MGPYTPDVSLLRNPITGIAGCCARAASGHVAAAPPRSVMNSRRFIQSPRRRGRAVLGEFRRQAPWRSLGLQPTQIWSIVGRANRLAWCLLESDQRIVVHGGKGRDNLLHMRLTHLI